MQRIARAETSHVQGLEWARTVVTLGRRAFGAGARAVWGVEDVEAKSALEA